MLGKYKKPKQNRVRILSVTLADCKVDTFRAGGHGGQNQNKVNSGVRITHPPSGAVGEARDSRDQLHNKRQAFKRMVNTPAFQAWVRIEAFTQPQDLRYEAYIGERWQRIDQ